MILNNNYEVKLFCAYVASSNHFTLYQILLTGYKITGGLIKLSIIFFDSYFSHFHLGRCTLAPQVRKR